MAVNRGKSQRVNEVLNWQRQASIPPGEGGLNYWLDVIATFFRMVRDPIYTFPLKVKVLGFLAFLYALSPIDVIPDIIPIVGWLDDMGIVYLGLQMIYGEIVRYRAQLPSVDPIK